MKLPAIRKTSGFTLVEMAIVLGIAGVLFGGLWNLMNTSNQQMRDQATASQQSQLISAVNTYLQGPDAAAEFWPGIAASTPQGISLPTSNASLADCQGHIAANPGLCKTLPPGFISTTTNPYGQSYTIITLKDASAGVPKTYSFIIRTSGGGISDTSGGRISSMIGGDGGFIYNNDTCTAGGNNKKTACGSFGTWNVLLSTYGIAANAEAGDVVSRTFYSPSLEVSDYWLARQLLTTDTLPKPVYNTMKTPLLLGNNAFYISDTATAAANPASAGEIDVQGGKIFMNQSPVATATGGGNIYLQGGAVNLGTIASASTIFGTDATATCNNGGGAGAGFLSLCDGTVGNPLVMLKSSGVGAGSAIDIVTGNMVLASGNITVGGGFIYQGSDLRLKTDIRALENPLAAILNIKPVSFTYKKTGKKGLGVIAQDLEKIYPQLVKSDEEGMKSVDYNGLVAPLIGSVQELKKENSDLRAQLRDQAERQQEMEREIQTLRAAK